MNHTSLSSERLVSVGDVRLAVVERGAGPPLLLVHGFPLDRTMWRGQWADDALAGAARLIAPDLCGFGRSEGRTPPVSMERLADDLAALLDGLGVRERIVLAGLSMGGYVAWAFWARHAERLRGLILCDTKAVADSEEGARARRMTAARVLREGPGVLVEGMLPRLLSAGADPELRAEVAARIGATSPAGAAAALLGMAERKSYAERLSEIDVPALVLCGAEDAISPPAEMRGIASALPHGRYVEIPGAGHLAPWERPAECNAAILAFLRTL